MKGRVIYVEMVTSTIQYFIKILNGTPTYYYTLVIGLKDIINAKLQDSNAQTLILVSFIHLETINKKTIIYIDYFQKLDFQSNSLLNFQEIT